LNGYEELSNERWLKKLRDYLLELQISKAASLPVIYRCVRFQDAPTDSRITCPARSVANTITHR